MRPKIYIGIMGLTGAGKSTFIKIASEDESVAIGETFKSCTSEVSQFGFTHDDTDIILIDTPGFNDTTLSETEVLKEIASWLDTTYRNPPKIRLSGIIYMQALDDRRMCGTTLRNLRMFRDLCGDEPLKNVIFTTTGWGLARKSETLTKALEKESELCIDPLFWEPMLRRGAQTARFEDTRASALAIINRLIPKPPIVLQIQHELVDESKNLIDTAAGSTVNAEIKRLEAKYQAELAETRNDLALAIQSHDEMMQSALQEHSTKLERLRDDARRAQDLLQYQRRNADRRYETEMQDLRMALEGTRAAAAAQKYEDELKFEGIVKRMRENMDRVRKEEREAIEMKIAEAENEGKNGKGESDAKKKKGKGKKLLLAILPVVGNVALTAIGFALGIGPLSLA